MILRSIAAAVALLIAAPLPALAQQRPAQAQLSPEERDLQAAIAKSNAYTALMNRTLRGIDSWERYRSWVDLKRGPTGKERYIGYGLYSLYDVAGEIDKAQAARKAEPALPEIDETVGRYIASYEALAPLITRAYRYYDRKDYASDDLALGKELHPQLVAAATEFVAQRSALEARMRDYKRDLDARELAAIEKREGRELRWTVRNLVVRARAVMDTMPSREKPVVDLAAYDSSVEAYAGAVRELDALKDRKPGTTLFVDSHAGSWLGRLREFRAKLGQAKGDIRRVRNGDTDYTWVVNNYNTLISLSDTALRTAR